MVGHKICFYGEILQIIPVSPLYLGHCCNRCFQHSSICFAATYFMTYHSVCKNSSDYIKALKESRTIAKNITKAYNGTGEVFPYR